MSKLGVRLRELRVGAGYTQKSVAEMIGAAQSTYTMYETGKREPGLDVVCKLANLFEVTADYLLGLSNYQNEVTRQKVGHEEDALFDKLSKCTEKERIELSKAYAKIADSIFSLNTSPDFRDIYYREVIAIMDNLGNAASRVDILWHLNKSIEQHMKLIEIFDLEDEEYSHENYLKKTETTNNLVKLKDITSRMGATFPIALLEASYNIQTSIKRITSSAMDQLKLLNPDANYAIPTLVELPSSLIDETEKLKEGE